MYHRTAAQTSPFQVEVTSTVGVRPPPGDDRTKHVAHIVGAITTHAGSDQVVDEGDQGTLSKGKEVAAHLD